MNNRPNARLRFLVLIYVGMLMALLDVGAAVALEIGEKAPDFSLDATTGQKIRLSDLRGKQAVLIEFYGADFAPV